MRKNYGKKCTKKNCKIQHINDDSNMKKQQLQRNKAKQNKKKTT